MARHGYRGPPPSRGGFAPLVERIAAELPMLTLLVCLDAEVDGAVSFENWLAAAATDPIGPALAAPPDDIAAIMGTSGTTGLPKGVMLTVRNFEVRSAMTLWGYPFEGRPVFLAISPLTHATGMFCFPMLSLGAEITAGSLNGVSTQPGQMVFTRLPAARVRRNSRVLESLQG
jgi:fatty-acyl-CoA synthase